MPVLVQTLLATQAAFAAHITPFCGGENGNRKYDAAEFVKSLNSTLHPHLGQAGSLMLSRLVLVSGAFCTSYTCRQR